MHPTDAAGPLGTDPTDAEVACFEAGVKFGSLYHQFAGTPVSPKSATSLALAIEESIENQPHCTGVSVEINEETLAEAVDDKHGYTELTGRLMEAEITIERAGVEVIARMAMEDDYPLMQVSSVNR